MAHAAARLRGGGGAVRADHPALAVAAAGLRSGQPGDGLPARRGDRRAVLRPLAIGASGGDQRRQFRSVLRSARMVVRRQRYAVSADLRRDARRRHHHRQPDRRGALSGPGGALSRAAGAPPVRNVTRAEPRADRGRHRQHQPSFPLQQLPGENRAAAAAGRRPAAANDRRGRRAAVGRRSHRALEFR
ncbi:Uncharacterised protein [Acinetobacter baumannii]|nr:Uncharacterised protein [Acinetobacter baumannii]